MKQNNIDLLTIKQATQFLKISRVTFYKLIKTDPRFPRIKKLGRSSRLRAADLERWIDGQQEVDHA